MPLSRHNQKEVCSALVADQSSKHFMWRSPTVWVVPIFRLGWSGKGDYSHVGVIDHLSVCHFGEQIKCSPSEICPHPPTLDEALGGLITGWQFLRWWCVGFVSLSLCETERSIGSTSVLVRSLSCSTISSLFQMDRFTCSTPCLWADTIKKKCALLLLLINQANTLCGVRQLCE